MECATSTTPVSGGHFPATKAELERIQHTRQGVRKEVALDDASRHPDDRTPIIRITSLTQAKPSLRRAIREWTPRGKRKYLFRGSMTFSDGTHEIRGEVFLNKTLNCYFVFVRPRPPR